MKKILIPTDFSENAGDALAYALDFIGNQKAHLHILHIVEPSVTAPELSMTSDDLLKVLFDEGRASMKAVEAYSKKSLAEMGKSQVKLTTNVTAGGTAAAINEEAKVIHADLIIMGTQGSNHSRLEKALGTISTGVLSDSPCPVILVPQAYRFKPIDKVLFATNLAHEDPYELWRATELIYPNISIVRCIHVVKDRVAKDDKALETFAKYMVDHSPSIQTIFHIELGKDIESVIAEYANDYGAELIIMHRSKRNFWEKVFGKSHTRRMAFMLELPLLVLN
ncbi:MAG: hypothetical protein DHS20C18_25470 [Saprospiraceae bacterium]|nr:MAG: hypothetical protein DHS20C18_25470 [Saprospiraceae bacterium]